MVIGVVKIVDYRAEFIILPEYGNLLMLTVGILSDTHGYICPGILDFLEPVDEIWHAGDLGPGIADQLSRLRPLRAVWGNIDGREVRARFRETEIFTVEEVKVLITHIGGYPGRYDTGVKDLIICEKPALFVCGHSHILKVMYDPRYELLHINPGAAGKFGWHKSFTAVRLRISGSRLHDLEVYDAPRHP